MKLPWGLRWWELVPEVVLATGLGLFFVTENDAATSAFKSSTAVVLMAVAAVGWLVVRVLLVRFTSWTVLRTIVFGVAAGVVLAVVVLPAFDDTTVVETLPMASEDPVPSTSGSAPGSVTDLPTSSTTPAEPVALRTSELRGIDHRARGDVVLYRQPDRTFVIGLEDIDIQPGPDYDVYLVPGSVEEPDGGHRLDDLRGNKGTQYYEAPAGLDPSSGPWTILVWCETFDVPVAAADLG